MSKYIKAVAAFIGALTPGAVVGVLAVVGVRLDAATVGAAIGAAAPVLALIATWRAPANTGAPSSSSTAPSGGE